MARAPAGKPTRPTSTRAASTAAAAALQDLAASSQPTPKPKTPKRPKKKTVAKPLAQDEQDWAREMLRKKMAALTGGAAAPAPAPAPAAAPKPEKAEASTSKEKAGKKPKDEGKEEGKEGKKEKSKKKKLATPRTVDVDVELSDDDEPPKKKAKRKGKEKAVEPETPAVKPTNKASSSVAVIIPAKSAVKAPPATPARAPAPAQTSSPAIEIELKKARRKQKKAEKAEKAAPAPEPAQPEPAASQAASEVDPAEKERKRKERKEKKKAKKAEEKKRKEAEESQQVEQAEPPAKKKDKGKGKAVEAPPPASPVKKATAPAASAASKKRKRAESPPPPDASPSRSAPVADGAKTPDASRDRKHKKRKVDAAAAVATQTTTEVILHAASPAALAAAKTASPLGPVLPMALAPFMMPHAFDEQQNKALVEQIVQNFVNAGYDEQVNKVLRGVKRSRTEEEQQGRVAPITDANAVAGPSRTSTSARTPAKSAAKGTPSAPLSSPLRAAKPPPSSAPQPTPQQQRVDDETPAASTRSSSPAPSALGLSLNGASNGSDGGKKRRVRPSKAARKAMSQALQSQPNTDVEEGSSVRKAAAVKAAVDALKQADPVIALAAAEDTQVVPETMEVESREPLTQPDEEDQLDATPRPVQRKAEDEMDVDVQAIEPATAQKQALAGPEQVEAEEQVESDEELDELDSTPAQSVTHQQQQRSNPAVSRVVESDSRAVTPSTSEDDDEEVQLSLKAHASPASAKKKAEDLPVEPEEAPLPPAAQTPSRNGQEEKEDEQKLSRAANARLPSSSPEPALPTIGGKRNDKDLDESSSSSEDESDESSDDEAGASSSLLTRNAAHLRNGGGGRPSLSLLAKEAFSKPKKRGSLLGGAIGINKVLASSNLGYAGSPLKHSPLNAASSSPARTNANGEAQKDDAEEEIDQLLSQTQPSQRPKRTSDAYWAQLEREEEEKKKRKGKGKQDETSDDDDEDRMEVDAGTAPIASPDQNPADVAEPAEADAAETAAAVNGAPATGEPVFANASTPAPRPSANSAGAPPITTAVEPDAALSPPRRRISPDPQPLPDVPAVASTSFLSPTQASQRPPDRIYPDLSSIGNLPTSSQAGSPPIEVDDPSQVFSGEDRPVVGEDDDEDEEEAQRVPAETQFVPLQKDKPLFLETQTQSFSQETAGANGVQELAADAQSAEADEAEAPADDEDAPVVKVNGSARVPPTPDASKETSPAPPAIVEPDQAEEERSADEGAEDEEDDGPTPKAAAFAKETGGLAVPTTPARITRASSARLASRSPSAEPPQAASQPVNGTPASLRRTYADRKKPESAKTSAPNSARMPRAAVSASQPTASTPSTFASGSRASRMLSLSQLDTVKQPTRRSTRASLAASASQPTTSQRSFIARDSDDEEDEDDDAASSDEEEEAGKGKGKVRKTRASMSQPVPGTQANGRARRSRQSDLWR